MAGFRIYIESETSGTIPQTLVNPIFSGKFTEKLEDGKIYYVDELTDKLKFDEKVDFDLILAQDTVDDCEKVIVTIEKLCAGEYTTEWVGYFRTLDTIKNYDRCWVEASPEPNDEYGCFEDSLGNDVNVYSTSPVIPVTSIAGTYETRTCSDVLSSVTFTEYIDAYNNPLDTCLAGETEWAHKSTTLVINGTDYSDNYPYNEPEPFDIIRDVIWHREILEVPCVLGVPEAPAFSTGWALLTDDCAGSGNATWWKAPDSGADPVGDYLNGRLFNSVVTRVVQLLNCSLTVKSDFFNLNPVGDAPVNSAYDFAANYLHHLTMHQASDIKNKTATNSSGSVSWSFTPEDFFSDLADLFNVFPIISGTELILEHYSFFTNVVGANDTAENMIKQIEGSASIKKVEKFFYFNQDCSTAFKSNHIYYPCGSDEEERRLKLFSTDVAFMEDPTNSDLISVDGFALISNVNFNGSYVIIDSNAPLTWTMLHENLHKYGRLYKSGTLNNVDQAFLSWKPYKTQEPYFIYRCCGDTFDPSELRTTFFGDGQVQEATRNILTGKIELQLAY